MGSVFLCGPAAAQSHGTRTSEIALTGNVELSRIVDLAAERLNLIVEYDPGQLKGPITIRSSAKLSDAELWQFTNRVLATRGFTTVRVPGTGIYSVVKLADAPAATRITDPFGPLLGEEPTPGFQSILVRAEHRPARELAEALTKVLSKPGGSAMPVGEGGLLLISDLSARLEQALALIKLLDTPAPGIVVTEASARAVPAPQLAEVVAQVSAKRQQVSGEKVPGEVLLAPTGNKLLIVAPASRVDYWRELIAGLDQRQAAEMVTYTPRYFPASDVGQLIDQTIRGMDGVIDERWRLVVDELTGSLVITATPSQHAAIRSLLDRLDQAPPTVRRPVRTFVVRNRDVHEVRSVLEQLLRMGVLEELLDTTTGAADPAAYSGDPPGAFGEPGAVRLPLPPQPTEGPGTRGVPSPGPRPREHRPGTGPTLDRGESPVSLTVDEGTNTIIAIGDGRVLSQIEALIRTLDVRQPQVMLEVLMLSLSESQALELGAELEQITIAGSVRIRLASLFGLGTRDAAGNRIAGDGSGFTGVVLSPGDFSLVVRALQSINRGRSLSMPKLLVANNQQATLNSVLDEPYLSVNSGQNVAASSYGGSVQAGTQVGIKPQIAEGDSLILSYTVSLSAFVGTPAAPGVPPPRQQNSINSSATIPDGYTVVVGGIELESESRGITQVPGLGSIPILGELFKTRSNNSSRSRFYVFIRASILRDRGFEDLKYISDQDIAKVDVDDGWPVVEPRIMR